MKLSILSTALAVIGYSQLASAAPTKTSKSTKATSTETSYIAQFSPIFPSTMTTPTDIPTAYNYGPYDTATSLPTTTLSGYPGAWESPDTDSDEVKAIINMIDWSLVPDAPVRKTNSKGFVSSSDGPDDPYCWWSSTLCKTPKVAIPPDYYTCGRKGDWGLSYDDGPFNLYTDKHAATENPFAEPALYNYLVEHNNQKATLFYIGSNVATYPAAAKRAFEDGHQICVHTWSHPTMTTQTNHQTVAELYWTIKAIKEATGITPKCWRPPQGDVDDRIRSIAWQMGLHTVIWDEDTNDWDMPAPGGGNLSPTVVDNYFKQWIANEKAGNQTTGHVVLEHELNHATVNMSMKWMPTIQKVFNVIPALACNNVTQPYWETQYVYPLSNLPINSTNAATASSSFVATAVISASATGSASIPTSIATAEVPATTSIATAIIASSVEPAAAVVTSSAAPINNVLNKANAGEEDITISDYTTDILLVV